jgi:hypothetical protein
MPGIDTSAAEVTHISAHGIWILIDDEELALPYAEFPWFRDATVDQILTVERPTADHLHWHEGKESPTLIVLNKFQRQLP